jgi:hypothetical protein
VSTVSEIEEVARPPRSLWDRILAEPDRAPEHIALAAAERFGPGAAEWARTAGAGTNPDQLARSAFRKHVWMARMEGGALGMGGIVTAAPDLVSLIWIQSRMVFYIAAAHGYDPNHPMRPAELLALLDLYATPAEARLALDGVGKHIAQAVAEQALRGRDDHALHIRLARYLGRRLTRRAAGRLVPFIGAPIGALQNGGVTKNLGRRALAYYGGDQARP